MAVYRHILVAWLASVPLVSLAQVPVSEGGSRLRPLPTLNGLGGVQSGGGATTSPSAQGELFIQLQQMQQELRSEEHTSELQSRENLVCRLLLEKKNTNERG